VIMLVTWQWWGYKEAEEVFESPRELAEALIKMLKKNESS